jgi:hypothetical protein
LIINKFSRIRLRANYRSLIWFWFQHDVNCLIYTASVLLSLNRPLVDLIHSWWGLNIHTTHIIFIHTLSVMWHQTRRSTTSSKASGYPWLNLKMVIIIILNHCYTLSSASHETFRYFIIGSCAPICLLIMFLTACHWISIFLILIFLSYPPSICNAWLLLCCVIHLYFIWTSKEIWWNFACWAYSLTSNSTRQSFFWLGCFLLHSIDCLSLCSCISCCLLSDLLKQPLSSFKL